MKYIRATSDMVNDVQNILHTAIKTIYPKYYPKEVVDFFCRHHNKEHILNGIASGNMGVLVDNDVIVGTGCFDGNHITGVYVLPAYQNQGCGSYIMKYTNTTVWKKKFPKHMIRLFWTLRFRQCVYMSIEVIKRWGMGDMNWKMM